MPTFDVQGVIRRWGNSYALRLRKEDFKRFHLREGQQVTARLVAPAPRIDLGKIPTFRGGGLPRGADREALAGEGYWQDYQEKMRRNRT
jgi:hypothetical protein